MVILHGIKFGWHDACPARKYGTKRNVMMDVGSVKQSYSCFHTQARNWSSIVGIVPKRKLNITTNISWYCNWYLQSTQFLSNTCEFLLRIPHVRLQKHWRRWRWEMFLQRSTGERTASESFFGLEDPIIWNRFNQSKTKQVNFKAIFQRGQHFAHESFTQIHTRHLILGLMNRQVWTDSAYDLFKGQSKVDLIVPLFLSDETAALLSVALQFTLAYYQRNWKSMHNCSSWNVTWRFSSYRKVSNFERPHESRKVLFPEHQHLLAFRLCGPCWWPQQRTSSLSIGYHHKNAHIQLILSCFKTTATLRKTKWLEICLSWVMIPSNLMLSHESWVEIMRSAKDVPLYF